ncbi:MAG: hypothetical protein CSA70_11260 [Rhodobacterales bacterium]|nr:MAG: hypothetical protein CSA70_11260 [Rhodobacterales bacterium]
MWGTVVAGTGAGVLSLATGLSEAPKPEATTLEVPAGSQFQQKREDNAAKLPGVENGLQTGAVPNVGLPSPSESSPAEVVDADPGRAPVTGQAEAVLTAPTSGEGAAVALSEAESGVSPTAPLSPPSTPVTADELSISTDPAQPQPPSAEAQDSAFATAPETGGTAPDVQSDAPLAPSEVAENQDDSGSSARVDPAREELVIVVPRTAGDTDETPEQAPATTITVPSHSPADRPTLAEADPGPDPARKPAQESKPADAAPQEEQVARVAIGTPATGIGRLGTGLKSNRLPSVAARTATDAETETSAGTSAGHRDDATELPPVERFANPVEVADNKPKMSIVLIDDGTSPIGVEALTTFPYPLSFAVDISMPNAADQMAIYRASGFEVLALASLPRGARASDVEVAVPAIINAVPEAVGIMEKPGFTMQSSREVGDQMARVLAESGHGLLLYPKGLNTAQKLAAKAGVRSATVFRDFDAKGQKPGSIRRFLNHAVLKADSEGGVVMVGRLRADTVTALLLWGLQDRASQVALLPISQLLVTQP